MGRLAADRQGVAALEYALIGGIIGVAVIAAFTAVWSPMDPAFTLIGDFLVSTASAGF
jgi:Flp pilus assembly pilin Flp